MLKRVGEKFDGVFTCHRPKWETKMLHVYFSGGRLGTPRKKMASMSAVSRSAMA
jgi:hypothetical protein